MSTRFSKTETDSNMLDQGYEGTNIPDDFSIPSCSIEDVDRAIFNLFNEEIPFFYRIKKDSRRVPVIFATGERFAILRRRKPLRDKGGTLILPLVSIMRTGIDQVVEKGTGPGQTAPLIIKKRLDKSDAVYQRLVNKAGLQNQDSAASPKHFSNSPNDTRAKAGKIASRRSQPQPTLEVQQGKLLTSQLDGNNIYEVITVPPVKYYNARYEVTLWSQYTQQMNDLLTAMMSAYQNMHQRTFRLETSKGYWFVAYVASGLESNSNFDDFADSERIIRYTFTIDVPAYIVNPSFPGAPNALRSFTTATEIIFDTLQPKGDMIAVNQAGLPSGDPAKYVLQDLEGVGDGFVASELVGKDGTAAVLVDGENENNQISPKLDVNLGGAKAGSLKFKSQTLGENPLTGKKFDVPLESNVTTNQGETTYKDLSTGEVITDVEVLPQMDV